MQKSNSWYEILESARRLRIEKDAPFTSSELAGAAGIKGVLNGSTPEQIASAWLSKFKKWGYVQVVGTVPGRAIRAFNAYDITSAGKKCKLQASPQVRLDALVKSVNEFLAARGTSGERTALDALTRAYQFATQEED